MDLDLFRLAVPLLLSFGLSALATPFVRRMAKTRGFLDRPGGRKDHARDVPPVGGLVIFPIALMVAALTGGIDLVRDWPLVSGLLLLLGLGAVDDARGLGPKFKFAFQTGAACLIVLPGVAVIMNMGDLFGLGDVLTGRFAIPLTIFCVVLLINAMNMIDGLDGLAGGMAMIALFWLTVGAGWGGDSGFALALAGGVAGFLVYNMRNPLRRKACVFLGDSGSMALGLALAWLYIRGSQGSDAPLSPVSVAWILGVPVMDAFALFVTRLSRGRHPFDADRRHFHHHLIHAGMTPGRASLLILGIGMAFGAIGIFGIQAGIPEPALMIPWVAFLGLNTAVCFRPERFIRLVARLRGSQILDPANDVNKPVVDPHGQDGDKDAKLKRNP